MVDKKNACRNLHLKMTTDTTEFKQSVKHGRNDLDSITFSENASMLLLLMLMNEELWKRTSSIILTHFILKCVQCYMGVFNNISLSENKYKLPSTYICKHFVYFVQRSVVWNHFKLVSKADNFRPNCSKCHYGSDKRN